MSQTTANRIHIVAGGHSTRLREKIESLGHGSEYPKHLLPTGNPGNETLLGRVVRQALDAPGSPSVTVHANSTNELAFRAHPDVGPWAEIRIGSSPNFLSAIISPELPAGNRALGCAGDFYAQFNWKDMLDHHEKSPFPVTFLAGNTAPAHNGLVFDVDADGQLTGMNRVERTSPEDLINIGAYIFDPDQEVLKILADLTAARRAEQAITIARTLMCEGLIGVYVVPGTPFNVNTPDTYEALRTHTSVNRLQLQQRGA